MRILIKKELTNLFCSGIGAMFGFAFLLICGLMLWVFNGSWNILDNGYATSEKFFNLSPLLLGLLIPAITMRSFSEEKKSGTVLLLISRPISISSIWISKWLSIFVFTILILLSSLIYIYTLYILGSPAGNIDIQVTILSYISLTGLVGIFIAIGLFASTLTTNQINAFLLSLFLIFFCYYGFDLIASIFHSGEIQNTISSWGLHSHFKQMQRGVIEIKDISTFAVYMIIAWIASIFILNLKNNLLKKEFIIPIVCIFIILIFNTFFSFVRFDFTQDKRYTISNYSKKILSETKNENIKINIYLEGNLNAGFQNLRNAINYFLYDLNKYAHQRIEVSSINPTSLNIPREELPEFMTEQGMPGILLNEVDRDGKLSRQIIYPYAQVIIDEDTLTVPLLKNVQGNTAEENLNLSAENLEFQFVDALRLLLRKEEQNIAFIEGHGEIDRVYIYDAEEALAKYFNINRGQIINDIHILDGFDAVIIAGPKEKLSETEKFILDQYIMNGGRVLWLLDGAYISTDDLMNNGQSASIKNEVNLDDMLFTYGLRIEPDLLQDAQSSQIAVTTEKALEPVIIPWYFSPLLLPSTNNIITKNTGEIKSEFVSSIRLLKNSSALSRNILLTTSAYTHILQVPEMIDFDIQHIQSNPSYFNDSFIPVAVSLEGKFNSPFKNRTLPDNIEISNYTPKYLSNLTKMVVVSTSSIIRNEITGQDNNTQVLPMGYDRISGRIYGNKEFIVNAVNWMVNDNEWMQLKTKQRTLNLLDKQLIYENRTKYTLLNTLAPLVFIGLIIGFVNIRRKLKYKK